MVKELTPGLMEENIKMNGGMELGTVKERSISVLVVVEYWNSVANNGRCVGLLSGFSVLRSHTHGSRQQG